MKLCLTRLCVCVCVCVCADGEGGEGGVAVDESLFQDLGDLELAEDA